MRERFAIILTFFLIFSQLNFLHLDVVQAESFDQVVMISAVDEHGEVIVPVTEVPMSSGDTAFDMWLAGAKRLGIDVDYADTNYGALIQTVAGKKASEQFFWSFVVNGKSADTGVSSYEVKHGDHLMLALRDLNDFDPLVNVNVSVSDADGEMITPETEVTVSTYATAYDVMYQFASETDKMLTIYIDGDHFKYTIDENDVLAVTVNEHPIEEIVAFQVEDSNELHIEIEAVHKQEDNQSEIVVNELKKKEKNTKENADHSDAADVSDDVLKQREQLKRIPPFSNALIQQQIKHILSYIRHQGDLEYGDEWWIWGLTHTDETIPTAYLESIKQALKDDSVIEDIFALEKIIISLSALGENATNFNGYHLIDELVRHPELKKASPTINSVIYGLLALDSGAYKVDDSVRKQLVDHLLQTQLPAGGWTWFGDVPTVDITAMVLQALAPYQHDQEVKPVIDNALKFLKDELHEIGGYYDEWSGHPSETTSQVIIALTALGTDPTSDTFTTPGGHLLEHLFKYTANDGGFKHVIHEESNVMATQQAFLALLAYQKYLAGEGSIFNYTAIDKTTTTLPKKSYQNKQDQEKAKRDDMKKQSTGKSHTQAIDQKKTGKKLPNTSTNMYNYLVIGSVSLLLGTIGLYRHKKESV